MIKIEKFSCEHLDKVYEIEKSSIETPWGYTALKEEIENENAVYFCVLEEGEAVGYGGMRVSLDFGDITNIAVEEKSRKKGYGKMIVSVLLEEAKKKGVKDVTLEVNENNLKAIRLYEKCGFKMAGIRKKYYNHKDNAIIMQINL